jgi:hypothetical protein
MGKLLAVFALVVVLVASAYMIPSGADERDGLNGLRDRVHHLSDRVEELQAVAETYKARLTEVADALATPRHPRLTAGGSSWGRSDSRSNRCAEQVSWKNWSKTELRRRPVLTPAEDSLVVLYPDVSTTELWPSERQDPLSRHRNLVAVLSLRLVTGAVDFKLEIVGVHRSPQLWADGPTKVLSAV